MSVRPSQSRSDWKVRLQLIALAVLAGALYAPVFSALVRIWRENDVYSHGFLVPAISLYFVWRRRERLRELTPAPSFLLGIPLVLLAGMMLLAGKFAAALIVEETSLLVIIVGLILIFLGKDFLKALALPVAYLVFMLPILGVPADRMHWPFQLLAARIGTGILQFIGIPAFQEGQYIYLSQITLEIVETCSGMRLLFSVIAIGIPLAYFTQRTWLRGAALIGLAVTISILANGFRVALIGAWVHYGGTPVHGPLHIFQGLFVAWIGYATLFAGAWLLRNGSNPQNDRNVLTGRPASLA